VDVYRGEAPPARSFVRYLLYVALFPQLIAGPIVRYHDIARQLDERDTDTERLLSGIWRFCVGLAKKVLIANVVAGPADWAFGVAPSQLGAGAAWLGLVCYALQIFFDFSAYSDMAIGLGRTLGFEFLENFDAPYISGSITEFWRRWHISLSTWMREYVYIPLGGNRLGPSRTYLNLWITFLFSGFWHGAAWNFVVWGAYHGALLSAHRWMRRVGVRTLPPLLARPATFLLVLLGWVFFRTAEAPVGQSIAYLAALFGGGGAAPAVVEALTTYLRDPILLTTLAGAALVTVAPLLGVPASWRDAPVREESPFAALRLAARTTVAGLLFLASLCALASGRFNPFIYFRF
jgi:alginate O-acetyltransferase complex protein AlgI